MSIIFVLTFKYATYFLCQFNFSFISILMFMISAALIENLLVPPFCFSLLYQSCHLHLLLFKLWVFSALLYLVKLLFHLSLSLTHLKDYFYLSTPSVPQ